VLRVFDKKICFTIKKAGTDNSVPAFKRVYAFHESMWGYNLLRYIPVSELLCIPQQQQLVQIMLEVIAFMIRRLVDYVLTIVNYFSETFQINSVFFLTSSIRKNRGSQD